MSKDQKQGNREAKKPKAEKPAAAQAKPFSFSQGSLTPIKPPRKAR